MHFLLAISPCDFNTSLSSWKGCWNKTGGGGVLPFMGYMGMCHCEGYGFQAVSGSRIEYHFSGN